MFCPKCKSILVPVKMPRSVKLVCKKCGYTGKETPVIKEKIQQKEIEITKHEVPFPKVKIKCPNCGNKEAYFWTQQTRSADEPETKFYECTKCGHRWREYS